MKLARNPALWFGITGLAACYVFFLWASARGFDVTDEATYLVWSSRPFSFHTSLSQYGYLWHPFYVLVSGDIQLFRIVGLLVLSACAALFAWSLARFIGMARHGPATVVLALIALVACVFWQYEIWAPSPDYDKLNLCALLLFFSGLMIAGFDAPSDQRALAPFAIGGAALAGVALGIMALIKPTSCLAAIALGVAWLVLVAPRRALVCLGIAAAAAALTVLIAVAAIDGSVGAFIRRNLGAYQYMRARDRSGDIHGIARSIVHPVEPVVGGRAIPAIAVGAIVFALALAVLAMEQFPRARLVRRAAQSVLLLLLGGLIAICRAGDLQHAASWAGYRAWHFPLLLILCAVAVALWLGRSERRAPLSRPAVAASLLLAAAPAAYSIGSNNTLIFHMSSAGIFWAAAALALAVLAEEPGRGHLARIASLLCIAATLGLLAGVVIAPGRIGPALWLQTEPVTLGPRASVLRLDEQSASYVRRFEGAAAKDGFVPGTPILDLSGAGPGIVYALDGRALGVPWLLTDGPDSVASNRLALSRVPVAELRQAWIVTGPGPNLARAGTVLHLLGVPFPAAYSEVVSVRHMSQGWAQTLWKPRETATPPLR